ncbi:MAG TPA: hypothetical protein VK960_06015 [Acidimicrobiia bacterium]|nr:hypothetical protein [Acidimicrobiia bacterium]
MTMNLDACRSERDADSTPAPMGGDAVEGEWVIQEHLRLGRTVDRSRLLEHAMEATAP